MGMTNEMLKKINEELSTDPDKVGYAGKTDEEIKVLLNAPIYIQRIVVDTLPSPMARIMRKIADAPNIVTDALEVKLAKEIIVKEIL